MSRSALLRVAAVVIAWPLIFSCGARAQSPAEPSVAQQALEKEKRSRDSGLRRYAAFQARFICPRYMMEWASGLHLEGRDAQALRLVRLNQRLCDMLEQYIQMSGTEKDRFEDLLNRRTYSYKTEDAAREELEWQKYLETLTEYFLALGDSARAQAQSLESNRGLSFPGIGSQLRKLAEYDDKLREFSGSEIVAGREAALRAQEECLLWLGLLPEAVYYQRAYEKMEGRLGLKPEDIPVCADCYRLDKLAGEVSLISSDESPRRYADRQMRAAFAKYLKSVREVIAKAGGFSRGYKQQASEELASLRDKALEDLKDLGSLRAEVRE